MIVCEACQPTLRCVGDHVSPGLRLWCTLTHTFPLGDLSLVQYSHSLSLQSAGSTGCLDGSASGSPHAEPELWGRHPTNQVQQTREHGHDHMESIRIYQWPVGYRCHVQVSPNANQSECCYELSGQTHRTWLTTLLCGSHATFCASPSLGWSMAMLFALAGNGHKNNHHNNQRASCTRGNVKMRYLFASACFRNWMPGVPVYVADWVVRDVVRAQTAAVLVARQLQAPRRAQRVRFTVHGEQTTPRTIACKLRPIHHLRHMSQMQLHTFPSSTLLQQAFVMLCCTRTEKMHME